MPCGSCTLLVPATPRLVEVYPRDGLQVGHGRERVGPGEGYTSMNGDLGRKSPRVRASHWAQRQNNPVSSNHCT